MLDESTKIQASKLSVAKKVEGFYNNDDVIILVESWLKAKGMTRGVDDVVVKTTSDGEEGQITNLMIIAPVVENGNNKALQSLKKDIKRAIEKK